jgi:hypothetical protein
MCQDELRDELSLRMAELRATLEVLLFCENVNGHTLSDFASGAMRQVGGMQALLAPPRRRSKANGSTASQPG